MLCPITQAEHVWIELDDPDRQDSPAIKVCALCDSVEKKAIDSPRKSQYIVVQKPEAPLQVA